MGFFRALVTVAAVATLGPIALAAIVPGGSLNNMWESTVIVMMTVDLMKLVENKSDTNSVFFGFEIKSQSKDMRVDMAHE